MTTVPVCGGPGFLSFKNIETTGPSSTLVTLGEPLGPCRLHVRESVVGAGAQRGPYGLVTLGSVDPSRVRLRLLITVTPLGLLSPEPSQDRDGSTEGVIPGTGEQGVIRRTPTVFGDQTI